MTDNQPRYIVREIQIGYSWGVFERREDYHEIQDFRSEEAAKKKAEELNNGN